LIDPAVREALERGTRYQRRAFAISCAELMIERLAAAGLGDGLQLRLLQKQTLEAMGTPRAAEVDDLLRWHETRAHEALLRLRLQASAAPPYVPLSSWRHALTGLRALLESDAYAAAARIAFQAVCATRDVEAVVRLSQELCGE
jgi:hypothetical protein